MAIPKPYFVRLEYYTQQGWKVGHAGIGLLDPARYVERLEARGKFGRATVLDPKTLQPTGKVWAPAKLPPRSALVDTDTHIPGLPDPNRKARCKWCDQYHGDPFDGSCLL